MVAGQALAMIASGLFSYQWRRCFPQPGRMWLGYAIPAVLGAMFMLLAVLPLAGIPGLAARPERRVGTAWSSLLAPLRDPAFLRLLAFGCWFSFFNGITQSVQDMYPKQVLEISLLATLLLATGMRCGQWSISPWLGRLADRFGNRPVMMASLAVVAAGPLGYFLATPAQPWWIVGASAAWVAYAGLNVGLPNLILKLAPQRSNTPYIASYYALTGLCVAASTILGGLLYDRFGRAVLHLAGLPALDYFHAAFLASWLLRSLGVLLLWWVVVEKRSGDRP
jgi:MFS family permease